MNKLHVVAIPVARFSRMHRLPDIPEVVDIAIARHARLFGAYMDIRAGDRVVGIFAEIHETSGAPDTELRKIAVLTNRAPVIEYLAGYRPYHIGSGFADTFFQYHVYELKAY